MLSVLLGLVLPVRGFSATDLGVVLERDRGAALVLEQAALPSIVGEGNRTRMFAWYNIVQDLGHALGSLMAGMPYLMRTMGGVPVELSYQISLGACAALFGTGIIFSSLLSPRIEVPGASERPPVSPKTRKVLFRLSQSDAQPGLGCVSRLLAGALMAGRSLSMPLFIGAGIKIGYDILLYMAFRNFRASGEGT